MGKGMFGCMKEVRSNFKDFLIFETKNSSNNSSFFCKIKCKDVGFQMANGDHILKLVMTLRGYFRLDGTRMQPFC